MVVACSDGGDARSEALDLHGNQASSRRVVTELAQAIVAPALQVAADDCAAVLVTGGNGRNARSEALDLHRNQIVGG